MLVGQAGLVGRSNDNDNKKEVIFFLKCGEKIDKQTKTGAAGVKSFYKNRLLLSQSKCRIWLS